MAVLDHKDTLRHLLSTRREIVRGRTFSISWVEFTYKVIISARNASFEYNFHSRLPFVIDSVLKWNTLPFAICQGDEKSNRYDLNFTGKNVC
jgi:hypothetical protein